MFIRAGGGALREPEMLHTALPEVEPEIPGGRQIVPGRRRKNIFNHIALVSGAEEDRKICDAWFTKT
jgi:hypothetical protein